MIKKDDFFQTKRFVRTIDTDRVYFNYKRAPYLRSKWPLVVLAIAEVGVLAAELLLNQTAYFQVITIPLILFCLYRILKHKEDIDNAVEANIVEEQLSGLNPNMYSGGYPFSVPVIPVHFFVGKTDYLLRS